MNSRRSRNIAVSLAGLGLLLGVVWAGRELFRDPLADLDAPQSADDLARDLGVPTAPVADRAKLLSDHASYLGSEACADCHAAICESYKSHPMSRSMSLAATAPAPELDVGPSEFNVAGPAGTDFQFLYGVMRDAGRMWHEERAVDAAGDELCRRSVPMHYAVGSGQRGHSYFHDAGGQLYMSPLTWYTGSGTWDLSPGYEKSNEHFERRIVDGCVFCHVGHAAPDPTAAHTFEPTVYHELSIGCERCHGPGADHVAFHRGEGGAGLETDPIVNPDRLEQPYRDDVCFQCHFQGVTRLTHPGRRDFDFRPGQAIADIWTVFMHGTKVAADNTTQAVGQAEQMMASRCYLESRGAMSCTSCHDPHSAPGETERVEYYRSRCLECHSSGAEPQCALDRTERLAASQADSCIECHMPKLAANDVPHTSQTDHRVIRRPDRRKESAVTGTLTTYQADRLSEDLVDRARGLSFLRQAEADVDRLLADRARTLLAPWAENNPSDTEAMSALGTAYSLTGDTRLAITTLEQVLAIDPTNEYTLRQLMYLSHDVGDVENGLRYGRRLIQVNPHHAEYHGRMAHMLGQSNQWSSAIESALSAVEIRPWDARLHGWLAEAYRVTGRADLAQQHEQLFKALRTRETGTQR